MGNSKIIISNIGHHYKTKKSCFEALKYPFSLEIKEKITIVLGPNGSGKSTLFKIISGQKNPTKAGKLLLSWHDLQTNTENTINILKYPLKVKKRVIFTFQEATFDERYSVDKLITLHGLIFGLSRHTIKKTKKSLLKEFELWDKRTKNIYALSGGQKKQFELIRGLLIAKCSHYLDERPLFFLADEPTAFCDAWIKKKIWDQLVQCKELGISLIIATNDLEEAKELGIDFVLLNKGKILFRGSFAAIRNKIQKRKGIHISFLNQQHKIRFINEIATANDWKSMLEEPHIRNGVDPSIKLWCDDYDLQEIMISVLKESHEKNIRLNKIEEHKVELNDLITFIN